MNADALVEEVLAAFSEAFPPATHRDYWFDWEPPGQRGFSYGVMARLRMWVEERLDLHENRKTTEILDGGHERLERYFDFIETKAAAAESDRDLRNLVVIETFECTVWTEQALAHLETTHGRQWKVRWPATHALLRWAQVEWAQYGPVGRWPD